MSALFNSTCPIPLSVIREPNIEKPIFGDTTTQDLLVYISLGSTIYTTIVCFYLILTHLLHYVRAREQRQIIRLAFYPLFYAIFSAASVYTYPDSIYLRPAGDLIEPIALAALFLLFLEYAESNPDNREQYFASLELKYQAKRFSKELGSVPGGSYRWFQGKWVALFCYFIADIAMNIVEIITQAAGRYCQSSFSLAYAHIWCTVIEYVALPVGIIAVIQFYVRVRHEPHVKPNHLTRKIWAFKGVLLLNFFQEIIFIVLVSTHVFTGTETVTLRDFQIGIPNCLLAIEQMVASSLFLWAFTVKPYKNLKHESKMNPVYALVNACNIMDLIYGSMYAIRLLAKGVGPYGNGTWNKTKSGYTKVRDPVTDVHLRRSHTVRGTSQQSMSAEDDAFRFEPIRAQQETPHNTVTGLSVPPSYNSSIYSGYDAYRNESQENMRQWSEEHAESTQENGEWHEDKNRLLGNTQSTVG